MMRYLPCLQVCMLIEIALVKKLMLLQSKQQQNQENKNQPLSKSLGGSRLPEKMSMAVPYWMQVYAFQDDLQLVEWPSPSDETLFLMFALKR
jgi:hypothetical protein